MGIVVLISSSYNQRQFLDLTGHRPLTLNRAAFCRLPVVQPSVATNVSVPMRGPRTPNPYLPLTAAS